MFPLPTSYVLSETTKGILNHNPLFRAVVRALPTVFTTRELAESSVGGRRPDSLRPALSESTHLKVISILELDDGERVLVRVVNEFGDKGQPVHRIRFCRWLALEAENEEEKVAALNQMKEDDVQVSMTWPGGVNVGSAKQTLKFLTKMENLSGVFKPRVRTNNILSDSSPTTLVWEPSCEKSATPEVAAACNKLDEDRATDVIDDELLDNNSDGVGDVTRNGYTDLDFPDSLPPTEQSDLLQVDSGASSSKCSPKNVNQLSQVKPCGVNNSTEPSHDGETDCIAEVSATPIPPQPASPSGSPRRSSNQPDIEGNVFDKINPCGANTSTETNNESETDCNAEVSPTSTPSPPASPSISPHMPGNHQNIEVQMTVQTVDDGSRGEAISIDALREELKKTRAELDSTRKELDNTRKELEMLKSGLSNSIADLENEACSSFTSGIKKI
ncbi:hypothetical protein QAD02_021925 [Eretmocerus hayati]|uniref:Uncharacterized protein n=1 Tax=Eretmocerus hayati TaxID=131215 RepID=A0ACC2PT57_9HYME|nr:hypothetical protein QAD02_021925 [Eretmocerus hayati]